MTTKAFFPYRTQTDPLSLRMEALGNVPVRDSAILAYDTNEPVIQVRAIVELPAGLLQSILPPEEAESAPADTWLIIRSKDSRTRKAERMAAGVPLQLAFNRGDWAGSAEMHAVLVRSAANPGAPVEFAPDRGSILAWSDPWRIHFDEPPLPGDRLDVQWDDFPQSSNSWRRLHAQHLFAVESRPGGRPIIFLNSAIANAGTVLNSRATHGAKARIRDAVFATISHQVWTALLGSAVAELVGIEDTTEADPDRVLANLGEFHRGILRDWAEYLYPDVDPGTALQQVIQARDPVSAADLLARIPNAIQTRQDPTCGFSGLVRDYAGM